MRQHRILLVASTLLLVASVASAGTVRIEFSGVTSGESPNLAFSGWLAYETPLPTVEDKTTYGSYAAHASLSESSFISWGLRIGTTDYAPVASRFHLDEIRVYDGTYGGTDDSITFFGGHLTGSGDDRNALMVGFRDDQATLLSGWGVPHPLPTAGWENSYIDLTIFESGNERRIAGFITEVTVVPLPAAVWPGFALLGALAIRRLRRRRG